MPHMELVGDLVQLLGRETPEKVDASQLLGFQGRHEAPPACKGPLLF
jgi:hypothetical protein